MPFVLSVNFLPLRREHLGYAYLMTIRSEPFKVEYLLWQTFFFSATELLNNRVYPC